MKERPILFTGEMVVAILDGRKTQTRRVVKHAAKPCRYGVAGDRLWVRENWRVGAWSPGKLALDYFDGPRKEWLAPETSKQWERLVEQSAADAFKRYGHGEPYKWEPGQSPCRWRPSIQLPRWASRIDLEILAVRRERLDEITEEDAEAEGVKKWFRWPDGASPHREGFMELWETIHGPTAWRKNPLVDVITFRRVRP